MAVTDMELEALVGHLFVVGGRVVSTASPGAIAMPPPRRTARGREADSFFGLLSLAPGEHQPAAFYEELSNEITRTYFEATGSVTAALREAINVASEYVYKFNRVGSDYVTVGLACAVLRGREMYVAVAGSARAFFVRGDGVERMPSEFELIEGSVPLGAEIDPDVRMYRHEVREGNFLLLADSSFNRLTDNTIRHATSSGAIADALSNLAGVASENGACEVINFVEPLVEEAAEGEAPKRPRKRRGLPSLPFLGIEDAPAAGPPSPARYDDEVAAGGAGQGAAQQSLRRAGQSTARGLARATGGLRVLVERWLPEDRSENPLEERFHLSTPVQLGIALGVALLTALLTTVVYQMRGNTSQYAQFVREAQAEIEQARRGAGNQAEARPHWETAVFLLGEAAEIRPPSEEIAALRDEALAALDSYDHVTRVSPVLLRTYPTGSALRGPIVQGLNVYVIDTAQDILYREDLADDSSRLTNRDSRAVVRQGELVGEQVVGGLIDLAWMEDGGVPQRNVLAVLTSSGQLITYSPSWDVSVSVLPGSGAWGSPQAIAVYDRDLYVLDAGASQIWRYTAGADAYSRPPEPYFTDLTPDLSDAVDLEIDPNGNIFVLHADGEVTKYFLGKQEAFVLEGFPQPVASGAALSLSVSPYDRALFIADPAGGRLYTAALNGTFLTHYRDAGDRLFDSISGLYRLGRPEYVYVTAGNGLYYFSRP